MRSICKQVSPSAAINACGSLAARTSFTIRPVSSTMQIAVSSKTHPVRHNVSWLLPLDACGRQHGPRSYILKGAATASAQTPITPSDSKVCRAYQYFANRLMSILIWAIKVHADELSIEGGYGRRAGEPNDRLRIVCL